MQINWTKVFVYSPQIYNELQYEKTEKCSSSFTNIWLSVTNNYVLGLIFPAFPPRSVPTMVLF